MDKKLKMKWLKALRSGKYKQTTGTLHGGDAYCCLGVLACVANLKISRDGDQIVVNRRGRGYAPIEDLVGGEGKTLDLWRKNDGQKWSFKRIAAFIEKRL